MDVSSVMAAADRVVARRLNRAGANYKGGTRNRETFDAVADEVRAGIRNAKNEHEQRLARAMVAALVLRGRNVGIRPGAEKFEVIGA